MEFIGIILSLACSFYKPYIVGLFWVWFVTPFGTTFQPSYWQIFGLLMMYGLFHMRIRSAVFYQRQVEESGEKEKIVLQEGIAETIALVLIHFIGFLVYKLAM